MRTRQGTQLLAKSSNYEDDIVQREQEAPSASASSQSQVQDEINEDCFAEPQLKRKRQATSAARKVDFDLNHEVFEITPLSDKPIGIIRMPDLPPSSIQEDMESPSREQDLELMLPPSTHPNKSGTVDGEEQEQEDEEVVVVAASSSSSNEAVNDSFLESVVIPRSNKRKSQRKRINNVPKIDLNQSLDREAGDANANGEHSEAGNTENPIKTLEQRHMMSVENRHAFARGGGSKQNKKNKQAMLWSVMFAPKSEEDFLLGIKTYYYELAQWLQKWRAKLRQQEEKENRQRRKEKRRIRRRTNLEEEEEEGDGDSEAEEADDDVEFLIDEERIINPLILDGPTGCGKTAMIWAAAKLKGFHVIEPTDKRDGQILEQKLEGALQSHNVNISRRQQNHTDIREMFSQPQKTSRNITRSRAIPTAEFTMILIDECDIVFASDRNFWPSLKRICADARIPVVLTCNSYSVVYNELNRKPALDNYWTIHMERPKVHQMIHYLQYWLLGFTNKFHKVGPLAEMIKRKGHDLRAVLNALQMGEPLEYAGNQREENDEQNAVRLGEKARQSRLLAQLDSAFQPLTGDRISFLVKQYADLDYAGTPLIKDREALIAERREKLTEYLDALHLESDIADPEPERAIELACLRLKPDCLFSVRDSALDYLPLLQAYHRAHLDRVKFSGSISRRAPPHPFEVVDPNSDGTMIDKSHMLKEAMKSYGHWDRWKN